MNSIGESLIRDLERRGVPGIVRRKPTTSSTPKPTATSKPTPTPTKTLHSFSTTTNQPKPIKTTQRIDPATLTEEQKLALKRWTSLSEEQQKDLSTKYVDAVNKKKKEKMEASYRPSTNSKKKDPSTDYNKWDQWAKEHVKEEKNSTSTHSKPTPSSYSVIHTNLLQSTQCKIEAFISCFLFSMATASICLPVELGSHTLTKQICFGLLMGACVLADQKGYVITCLGGLEGMTCGMGLFRFIGKIIGNDDMGLISLLIVTVGFGVVGVQLRQKMYQQTGR